MTTTPTTPAIEVSGLRHSFKTHVALQHVDFVVQAGSIHGFVGPNGAGKTTTLKVLATLLQPDGGKVRVHGLQVRSDAREVRRAIGYMPDHFAMYRQMKVGEYLDFFAAAYGQAAAQRQRTVDDVLQLTDMGGRRDDLIKALSRGMQQRVSLARALVHDPSVLLLDEPASGLDPRARIELMAILEELSKLGKTVFISSHILGELATLCDAVTIIDAGHVKYSGAMDALLEGQTAHGEYEVRLGAEDEGLCAALEQLAGVTGAEARGRGEYRVRFEAATPDTAPVLRLLIDRGVEIVAFQRAQRRLDEAFLDLTEPGVRA